MAIAYDNSVATSFTQSTSKTIANYAATTNNPYIVVGIVLGSSTDAVTGVTFNSSPMTFLAKIVTGGGSYLYLYGIAAGGTHDIVISCSSTQFIQALVSSYSGVLQATPTNGTATNNGTSTDANASITTTVDKDWTVSVVTDSSGGTTFSAGTNTTQRQNDNSNFPFNIGDSNGVISPAGAYAMHWTKGSSQAWKMAMVALQPAASTSYTQTCTDAITVSSSLSRTISRPFTASITVTGILIRTLTRTFTQAITNSDTFTGLRTKFATLIEAITNTDTLRRTITYPLTEAFTVTGTLIRTISRALTEAIPLTDTLTQLRTAYGIFIEAITAADTIVRTIARSLSETITITASLIRTISMSLAENVGVTDTFARVGTFVRVFVEQFSMLDFTKKMLNGRVVIWANQVRHLASFSNQHKNSTTWHNQDRSD